ncbi:MAG: lipase family protein [Nevskiales bacterium]|nr:lipase family protein [Nevskiales bacterium]
MGAMEILETTLAVVFVYLILSLIATAAAEVLERWNGLRGKTLRDVLASVVGDHAKARELLLDDARLRAMVQAIDPGWIEHLQKSLVRKSLRKLMRLGVSPLRAVGVPGIGAIGAEPTATSTAAPSYLEPRSVAEALLRRGYGERWRVAVAEGGDIVRGRLGASGWQQLEALRRDATGPDDLLGRVAEWIDEVNARSIGWYKRRLQARLLWIGVALALVTNADTVQMMSRFASDPQMRAAAVARATQLAEASAPFACDTVDPADQPGRARVCLQLPAIGGQRVDGAGGGDAVSCAAVDPAVAPASATKCLQQFGKGQTATLLPAAALCPEIQKLPNPTQQQVISCLAGEVEPFLGWRRDPLVEGWRESVRAAVVPPSWFGQLWQWLGWQHLADLLLKVVGLLVTAVAVSMGAPFWFDLLNKLVSLRSSQAIPVGQKPAGRPAAEGGAVPATAAAGGNGAVALAASEAPSRWRGGMSGFDPMAAALDLRNADWLAYLAALAYQPDDVVRARLKALGLDGRGFASARDTQGFVAWCDSDCFIVFRGTQELRDWQTDLDAAPVPAPDCLGAGWSGSAVHQGFAEAYAGADATLKGILRELPGGTRRLWLAGHSLGGALAQLCAAALEQALPAANAADAAARWIGIRGVYTYGSPRVGDARFAEHLERSCSGRLHRFVNQRDAVARVPLEAMGYRHAGTAAYFDALGRLHVDPAGWFVGLDTVVVDANDMLRQAAEVGTDHRIGAYREALRRELERRGLPAESPWAVQG